MDNQALARIDPKFNPGPPFSAPPAGRPATEDGTYDRMTGLFCLGLGRTGIKGGAGSGPFNADAFETFTGSLSWSAFPSGENLYLGVCSQPGPDSAASGTMTASLAYIQGIPSITMILTARTKFWLGQQPAARNQLGLSPDRIDESQLAVLRRRDDRPIRHI